MTRESPAYYVVRKGRGYWQPTPKMKQFGFFPVQCGPDGPAAWDIAEAWNEKWQRARAGDTPDAASELRGFVYFLRQGNTVKVGFTTKPNRRLTALQTGSSVKTDSFIMVRGTKADEKQLHRRFAAYHRHGEWFTLAEPVRKVIMRAAILGVLPTLSAVA